MLPARRRQAESIADQLSSELSSLEANFQSFLDDAVKNGDKKFSGFLVHGLNDLKKRKFVYRRNTQSTPNKFGLGGVEEAENAAKARSGRLGLYERDTMERVNSAFSDCVSSVELAEPGGPAKLCEVYSDIKQNLELKSSLFGVCDFKDGLPSVEAFCKVE